MRILEKDNGDICATRYISVYHVWSQLAVTLWWVFLLKIADCIETVIFVLRKKHNQVSVLHLYHHVSTIILIWMHVKYLAGEMTSFVTLLNCTVHIIMYNYYFLATFGPHVRAIIARTKRYVTIIQMVSITMI